MLKFFRLYNKYILVIGGAILMVAFLIQPALSIFQPQQADQPVGTLDGRTITYGEQSAAAMELHLLSQLPALGAFTSDDPLTWLLMVHDARRMGLSASDAEVQQMLQTIGLDDAARARILQQLRVDDGFINQAIRHWLIVQAYRELLLGQVHTPVIDRISTLSRAQQMLQQGNYFGGASLMSMANGSPRISEPLVRRFLYDQYATVSGETVLMGAERYLDQVEAPSQAKLESLFQQYRDVLPGEGEPYGFGYRTPARIKIESLVIPIDQVMAKVTIEEAERQDFYDQNRERFTPAAGGEPQPYVQVRDMITAQLTRQRADELAGEMIRTARNLLVEHEATRRLPEENGYRQIPQGFEPMPLEEAARVIAERYGVEPRVHHHTAEWIAVDDLEQLPIVGDSFLASRREVSIGQYIQSAREMNPASDNPLTPLRLQVGLPSAPMQAWDGSYALFRLTDAAPARSPESLDEVRAQVERDARELAAYELLLKDRDKWVAQAKQQGLKSFATEVGAVMLNVQPTPRGGGLYGADAAGGPVLPGIGPAGDLLAAMFEVGQSVAQDGAAVDSAPAEQRTGAAPLDRRRSLAVFRVDGFEPMSHSQYEAIASDPRIGAAVSQSLQAASPEAAEQNPLSFEAIAERVGFVRDGEEESGQNEGS